MNNLEWALEYLRLGLSVIPVAKDKKPLVTWKNFMTIPATPEQVQSWWMQWPDANVGIVTGQLAGITAVDVDSKEELQYVKKLVAAKVPRFLTGRGGQYLFKWNGESNTTKVNGRDIDIRGEGGFSVAPESVHSNGSVYKWIVPFSRQELTTMPEELRPRITEVAQSAYPMTLEEGSRDNDLYHVAHVLMKDGVPKEDAASTIRMMASACSPPMSEKEALQKVDSAYKKVKNTIESDIRDFLRDEEGERYGASEIATLLGINNNSIRMHLKQLYDKGHIRKEGKKYYVPCKVEKVDPFSISAKAFNIQFPFGIHDFSRIAQGDVVLISGTKNSGKSAFLAETALLNMSKTKINYIFTENVRKIGERFVKWGYTPEHIMDRTEFIDARSRIYDSVVDPNALNILDYYNPAEGEYNKVAVDIEKMSKMLNKGVLIIGIQQREDQPFARGGALSEELAQLVVTLKQEDKSGGNRINRITLKMIKEEAHRPGGEGKSCQYTFSDHASGSRPQQMGEWEWEGSKKLKKAGIPEEIKHDNSFREPERDMPQLF